MYFGVFMGWLCVVFVVYGVNFVVVCVFGGYDLNVEFVWCLDDVLIFGGGWRVDCVLDMVVVLMLGVWLVMLKVVVFIMLGGLSRVVDVVLIMDVVCLLCDLGVWFYVIIVGWIDLSEL